MAKYNDSKYQEKYRMNNRDALLAKKRSRYAKEKKKKEDAISLSELNRLTIERAGGVVFQQKKCINAGLEREEQEVAKKRASPTDKRKLYSDQIDELYEKLNDCNPLSDDYELIYSEINNKQIKLLTVNSKK